MQIFEPELCSNPHSHGERTCSDTTNPDLCRNATDYTNNHKNKDVVEITLHFINIKELKLVYRQDGNKLARVLVDYLSEEMWQLHGFELYVTMRLEGLYIIEKQWKPSTSENLTLGGETLECGPRWVTWYQFPGVITLAYFLCLTHMIHR